MANELLCWKCGTILTDLAETVGRHDVCLNCRAELYVCKMCEFYDPRVSNSCREPIADAVNNKERANFCGYFKIRPNAYQPPDDAAKETTQVQLKTLFGEDAGNRPEDSSTNTREPSEADIARERLERLFGSKDSDDDP